MSDIKVNTDDLRSNSSALQRAASELANSIYQISAASASLDPAKYQGQFAGKVQGDTSQVQGSIVQFQNRLQELGSELSTRATAFEAANEDSSGEVLRLSTIMNDFMGSSRVMSESARMRQVNTGKANSIWILGGSVLGGFMGWLTNLPPFAGFKKNPLPLPPTTIKLVKASKPWGKYIVSGGGFPTYGDGTLHNGIDIVPDPYNPSNTYSVYPIGPGKVFKVGQQTKQVFENGKPKLDSNGKPIVELDGYGNYVIIEHELSDGKKIYSRYAHLASYSSLKEGSTVISTTELGQMGSTGRSTNPHLHLETFNKANPTQGFWYLKPSNLMDPDDPKSPSWETKLRQDYIDPKTIIDGTSNLEFKVL